MGFALKEFRVGCVLWTECLYPPKIHMLKPNPQCGAGGRIFKRLLGHEGGALINGISALIKKDTREVISLSTT